MGCIIAGLNPKGEGRVGAQLSTEHIPIDSYIVPNLTAIKSSVSVEHEGLYTRLVPKGNSIPGLSVSMTCRIPTIITPTETYTRLSYIEATGAQYIDLGYIVKETDVIEMCYRNTLISAEDKFYFGVVGENTATWADIYNSTSWIRFGQSASQTETNMVNGALLRVKKNSFEVNNVKRISLNYVGMPSNPLILFANKNSDGVYGYGSVQCRWWRVIDAQGNTTIDLHPMKRNDGKIGMLDLISGTFYTNEGTGADFIMGDELNIPNGYELIDYVSFNADKLFDAGYINSSDSIFCQFLSNATGRYIYGAISSPHKSTVTLYTGAGSNWRWGTTALSHTTNNDILYTTEQTNGSCQLDYATKTRSSSSAFTTAYPMPLGGYVSAAGAYTANFKGQVYRFAVKNGDTYLHDWYPCKRTSDGVEGFWDCVTQTFIEPI